MIELHIANYLQFGIIMQVEINGEKILECFPVIRIKDKEYYLRNGAPKISVPGGYFIVKSRKDRINRNLTRISIMCTYHGRICNEVKIILRFSSKLFYENLEYYTYAGRVWNGNKFGIKVHEFGDELREDRFSVPSCITLENKKYVMGVWVEPQRDIDEPLTSAGLRKNDTKNAYEVDISAPYTDIIPNRVNEDQRFNVDDGWCYSKIYYIYVGEITDLPGGVTGLKHGYAQVFNAAWDLFYPESPTKPESGLKELCEAKLKNMLQDGGLLRRKRYKDNTYTIWYVAKSDGDVLHSYAGFSWSGYLGMAAYHAIKHWKRTGDKTAKRNGISAIDFFLENGLSKTGLIYPVMYDDTGTKHSFGIKGTTWGTYFRDFGSIDMNPLGEGMYWILKAYELVGEERETWLIKVRDICERIMELWEDGDIPARIRGDDGAIVHGTQNIEGEDIYVNYGTPGNEGLTSSSYLIWAFIILSRITGNRKYLDYAEKIGDKILDFALRHEIYWKSEHDTHCIDKRAGHGALKAFNMLYENTKDEKWLGAAIRASDWLSTWQWHYNVIFDKNTPLGHYDYRTIGGTEISVQFNGLQYAFAQAATEWCKLWRWTGEKRYLERARALLHQGTQLLLTPKTIRWLNENYLEKKITDEDFIGAQVEDIMSTTCCYPTWETMKGDIQIRKQPFYSMFGLVMPLDALHILDEFGSVCYSARWMNGEGLDTVELIDVVQNKIAITLKLRNMLDKEQVYTLKVFDLEKGTYDMNGIKYSADELQNGVELKFDRLEIRSVEIKKRHSCD